MMNLQTIRTGGGTKEEKSASRRSRIRRREGPGRGLTSEDRGSRSLSSDGLSEGSNDDDHQLESVLEKRKEEKQERRQKTKLDEQEQEGNGRAHHLFPSDDISEPSEKQLTDEGSDWRGDLNS